MKNTLTVIALSFVAVATAFSVEVRADTVPRPKMSPAEFRAKIEAARKKFHKPSGGLLVRKHEGPIVAVVDKQTHYSAAEIETVLEAIRLATRVPAYRKTPDSAGKDAAVRVVLEDEPLESGATVLCAPEQGWARMSVSWLTADVPDNKVKARRLRLELMRTIAMSMGVGVSMYQPCIMTNVRKVADLDALKVDKPGPEGLNNLQSGLDAFGVKNLEFVAYRKACQEGWAPAPANAEQKAVWDEIHSLPTQPIRIEPESKRK